MRAAATRSTAALSTAALSIAALVTGGALFLTSLALGLAAALRFRDALERSAAGCGLAVGRGLAWCAVTVSVAGIVAAGFAVLAEYRWHRPAARPVAVVVAAVVAGAGVFAAALNLFIVHEIGTCAALFG